MTTAFDFLLETKPPKPGKLCVVYGEEEYLKHAVISKLAGTNGPDSLMATSLAWRDVHDALTTISLFDDAPVVVVIEEADKFVTEHRARLEEWVSAGRGQRLLVLNVRSWTKTTRLAKQVAEVGLAIDCGIPNRGAEVAKFNRDLRKWLTERASQVHGVRLDAPACNRLLELLPTSPGMLDLELAKLSLLATDGAITVALVEEHVGDWRTRQAWDMIDLMANGQAAEALRQLDKLLASGEEPIGVLAQIASTLRRFGTAAQLIEQAELAGRRPNLEAAIKQAGFPPFKQREAVQQLRSIGRVRARQIPRWLLEIDFASKDYHSSRPMQRFEIERLIVRLSPQARPEAGTAS